jgi:hypothetical protein
MTSLTVAEGFSSIIQWPESGTIASCTSVAAKRITVAIIVPNAASPPIASTGIVSLPLARYALLSMASWPKAANWAKPARMARPAWHREQRSVGASPHRSVGSSEKSFQNLSK